MHVLLSDDEAEHLPGCNMAFRRDALLACGGFDPQFCVAGDDVDICWQMRRDGGTIGFSPAAVVWHRRRSSIHAYLRQQAGYGRSEALLERKWPERYNATGHARWSGRLYGPESPRASRLGTRRVGYGTWGREPFQSIYEPAGGVAASLLRMPEWYLLIALLTLLGAGGLLWAPLLPAIALAVPALLASLADAGVEGLRARGAGGRPLPVRERALIAALHALQPAARLWGRVEFGLAPWRNRGGHAVALPWPRIRTVWSETWSDPYERLVALESALRRGGSAVRRGGRFDRWDLEVSGLLAGVRTRMVAEEHGGGRQLVRFRTWPRLGGAAARILGGLVAAALLATASGHEAFAATVIALAGLVAARGLFESAAATRQLLRRLDDHRRGDEPAALPAGEQA